MEREAFWNQWKDKEGKTKCYDFEKPTDEIIKSKIENFKKREIKYQEKD